MRVHTEEHLQTAGVAVVAAWQAEAAQCCTHGTQATTFSSTRALLLDYIRLLLGGSGIAIVGHGLTVCGIPGTLVRHIVGKCWWLGVLLRLLVAGLIALLLA